MLYYEYFNYKVSTCMTLMGRLVSLANCSRMCLVGLGVCEKAVLSISSCLALMVVLGPRLLDPELPSSGDLFSVWLSLVSGSPSKEPLSGKDINRYTGIKIVQTRDNAGSCVYIIIFIVVNGSLTLVLRILLEV